MLFGLDAYTLIMIVCAIIAIALFGCLAAAWMRAADLLRRARRRLDFQGRKLKAAQEQIVSLTADLRLAYDRANQITDLLRDLHTDIRAVRTDQVGQVTAPLLPRDYRPQVPMRQPTGAELTDWATGRTRPQS